MSVTGRFVECFCPVGFCCLDMPLSKSDVNRDSSAFTGLGGRPKKVCQNIFLLVWGGLYDFCIICHSAFFSLVYIPHFAGYTI
jgi:hypothetical protein